MAETFYRQCTMRRGALRDVAWMPEKFCKIGRHVRIGDEDGWLVTGVGDVRRAHVEIIERGRDWKRTREASDI